ncbi:hypothetical protein [Hymenobacter negativus]|uniref:Glycosyltransferase RgtA/B/C/D-like domain-containing protein n=1 Tax=Hymenobacter negativus TaxID=2795026 RepID=A0ABS0Q3E9_9BACT|nr:MULTISPECIES: hypothetical protein [Bacteria]MBH8556811.1 hypothetical protein [Hymenobacter negativus]MBH8569059.1 hypothetical protein [Hymenobacter negativus]MBR7208794.1 hypothetical protein [Microvirga sp. STS02]
MKVVLAILLNAALLAGLLPWLRRQWREAPAPWWRAALVAGLGVRVAVGLLRNWDLQLDAKFMSDLSQPITAQLWAHPGQAWQTLTQAVTLIHFKYYTAVFQGLSNTWFFIKALAFLNLASGGIGWLNGLYLSLFAFVSSWQLVRVLARVFPNTPAGAGAVAFLLWPSVWFWATGLSKESLLVGSGAWLTALVLERLYEDSAVRPPATWRSQAGWWVAVGVLAFVHFKMRYFFAAPLLAVLVGIALVRSLQVRGLARPRWAQAVALVTVLASGLWLAQQVSVAFSVNKFTNQVVRVYTSDLPNLVGRPHFEYPDLRPTLESVLSYAPLAVANTLTRPFLGEARELRLAAAGAENLLLLVLIITAAVGAVRGRAGHLPFILGLGLLIFCIVLAALMGLTTPNLGSLHRYRSDLMPYLVLLLLQNDYAATVLRRLGLRGK